MKVSGEENAGDVNVVSKWTQNNIPKIFNEFSPKDIFNVDEAGIFYKLKPEKTLAVKGTNLHCLNILENDFYKNIGKQQSKIT